MTIEEIMKNYGYDIENKSAKQILEDLYLKSDKTEITCIFTTVTLEENKGEQVF